MCKFLAGLKQFQYRKLWNRATSLGIWRSVFSRREFSVFSSWMQLCLNIWTTAQTHLGFLHRKLMLKFGTLPEISCQTDFYCFFMEVRRIKSALWGQRLAQCAVLPNAASSVDTLVDSISNLSTFRKAPWARWPWEHYMTHLIYKNKLSRVFDLVCQTNEDFYQDLSPSIERTLNVLQ